MADEANSSIEAAQVAVNSASTHGLSKREAGEEGRVMSHADQGERG